MTKKFLISLVLIVSLALATAQYAFSESNGSGSGSNGSGSGSSDQIKIEKELKVNMRDQEVSELQVKLKQEGLLKTPVTGFFGPLTEKAVKEFQKKNDLAPTGMVDQATKNKINNLPAAVQAPSQNQKPSANSGQGNAQSAAVSTANQVQALVNIVNQLLEKVQKLQAEVSKLQTTAAAVPEANAPKANSEEKVDPAAQAAAGVIITGGVSGPGYPTGPLNLVVPAGTQLLFDKIGQVNGEQIKGRQYETPLDDTVPPTGAPVAVTVNGVANTAGVKIIHSLKTKNGAGQHQGTIDIDIDTLPAGHVTLQFNGTATVAGSTIASKGTFKTSKATGIFTGLVAEGTYDMTIIESAQSFGSPVTVSITTVSP